MATGDYGDPVHVVVDGLDGALVFPVALEPGSVVVVPDAGAEWAVTPGTDPLEIAASLETTQTVTVAGFGEDWTQELHVGQEALLLLLGVLVLLQVVQVVALVRRR